MFRFSELLFIKLCQGADVADTTPASSFTLTEIAAFTPGSAKQPRRNSAHFLSIHRAAR